MNQSWHDDLVVAIAVLLGMAAAVVFMVAALVGWFTL